MEKFMEMEKITKSPIMNFNQTTEEFPIMWGDAPELNSKSMFRPAVDAVRKEYDDIHESKQMASLMDGAGECGKFIWLGYEDDLLEVKARVEARFNVDLEVIEKWLYKSVQLNNEFVNQTYSFLDKVNDYEMIKEINEAEK